MHNLHCPSFGTGLVGIDDSEPTALVLLGDSKLLAVVSGFPLDADLLDVVDVHAF